MAEETKEHPGFKAVSEKIAKQRNVTRRNADAILAAITRRASTAAKQRNPNLKKVR